jgi:hypothetical protein
MTWGTPTEVVVVSSGASLTNDTISSASSEFANGTSKSKYAFAELVATIGTAASDAVPRIDLGWTVKADGTNYQTAPVTGFVNQGNLRIGSHQVTTSTSAQRLVYYLPDLPPEDIKFYIDNQSGETISSGWTLKTYHYSEA